MFARQSNDKTKDNGAIPPAVKHLAGKATPAQNPAWQSLALRSSGIQTKLTVSEPGDAFEQEADRVAEHVMRMAAGPKGFSVSGGGPPQVQLKCGPCEDEDKELQRKEQGGNAEPVASALVDTAMSSAGQPLDPSTRSFMEERFAHDFGQVRVHHDARAAESARAVNALAYTVDQNVVFGAGQFRPATESGRRLLAHELVHTIQQGNGSRSGESGSDAPARNVSRQANRQVQRAPDCQGDKPADPDTLGPLFVKPKSDVEKLGLAKQKIKPRMEGKPYVLFSPHCQAGAAPLQGLIDGGDAFLISSGKIYKQVWAQQEGKPADKVYWGWINPQLIEAAASPAPPPVAPTTPPKTEPPQACPGAGEQKTCETPVITAKPADCPPGLDDSAALVCFSQKVREEVRHQAEGDIYQARLKQAVELLQRAGFGRLEGIPIQFEPGAPPEWEGETYNKEFWKAEDHPKFLRKLVLKPGKQPADAIDDMFANLGKWKVDCGQFVQVAHLYALRHALGTKGFNDMNKKDVAFELKPQGSTAVQRLKFYERFGPEAQMIRHPEKELETKSADELLKAAPTGSRIMWTNLKAPIGSAFRNENALKLGDDQFAAHGFMGSLKKNLFTRKELEQALAKTTNPTPDDDYIKANVFISEIEQYLMPQNPKP